MPKFVALLRGVNVGKAKRVPMADLRTLLATLGYSGVTTLLNSGNVVFHAAKGSPSHHAAQIGGAIAARLNVEVPVIVKSAKNFAAIVAENPIEADPSQHSRLLVAFVQEAKDLPRLGSVKSLVVAPEQFALGRNAAYLLCAGGILESKAAAALLGKPGRFATSRNWATVLKLQALALT